MIQFALHRVSMKKEELQFRSLTIEDYDWVTKLLRKDGGHGCQYTFTSLFVWQEIYNLTYAKYENCLLRKSEETKERVMFHYPIGAKKDRIETVKALKKLYKGKEIFFYGVSDVTLHELKELYGENAKEELIRDNQNYIYKIENLASLTDKMFRTRRQQVRAFTENGEWSFGEITPDNLNYCTELNEKFFLERGFDEDLQEENRSFLLMIKSFEQLGIHGYYLKQNGEVVGYVLYETIQEDMCYIMYEKALRKFPGSYAMLIQQYSKVLQNKYKYMNWGEDVGNSGLRKAKLSYRPIYLTEYYNVTV